MTLRTFLDAAYVVLAEEYRRIGSDLQSALKELELYRAGGPPERGPDLSITGQPKPSKERQQVVENQRALDELQKLMAGTSFS
jgi:hypothetical protein